MIAPELIPDIAFEIVTSYRGSRPSRSARASWTEIFRCAPRATAGLCSKGTRRVSRSRSRSR